MNMLRCLLFLLMTLIVSPTSAEELIKVSLQLRWDSQFQFAGYYAAKWQGYYADAGLDVDIRSAITPDGKIHGAVKEVADGNADFGIGAADILIGIDQGTPLVLLASIFQQSAAEFYAKEETVLQSPADLLNLKVARNVNDLIDVELQSMLLAEGINPNKIVPFKHMPGIQPLVDGSVDVIPGYRLSAPFEFEMQGMKVKTLRPISYGIDFYGDTLFTHARMIEQDAKIVERFRQASLKGWQYALEHSLEIADRITREVPRRAKLESGELLRFNRYQIQIVKELTLYPIVEIGSVNPHRWLQMNALMRKIGAVKNEIDIDKITFDPEKIEQNNRNRTLRFLINAIYLTVGVLFLAVVFIILLKRQVSRATRKILQREVSLRESEEIHRGMIANISDVIAIMDGDGTILYKSPNIEKWFGWQPEDLVGTDGWQTVHPGDIERLQKEFSTLLDKDNSAAMVEYRYKCKDGSYKLIELTAVNLTNDPLIRGVLMNYHDITERKQAEEELRFQYEIMINMTEAVYLIRIKDGVIVYANSIFEKMFGYEQSEMIGKHVSIVNAPIERNPEETAREIMEILNERGVWQGEVYNIRKDGTLFWCHANVSVFYHSKYGKVLLAIHLDITERKRAEESLRESEERLRNAQRIGKLGSLDWNLATNELLLSEETLAIFGLKKGKNIFALEEIISLLHPEDKQRVEKSLNDAIANNARHDLEHRMIRPDGEVIYIRAMAELFHSTDGKSVRLMGTIRNISERKQSEMEKAELEAQTRQLQKSDSLGRMAGAIAHHFNNQLYAVMGNLEMALDGQTLGVNSNENLVSAMQAARKAADVSRLMLTYLGQTPGKQEPIDLSEAYNQSQTLLQAAAPRGIIINAEFPPSGPVIRADTNQMHQILTNLVTNAWESISDSRGTIDLIVKTISHEDIPISNRFPIDWQPQSIPYACLEVSDTGHGISDRDIEKLFDPFFTTKFTGRGLGLSVVMGIVKAHGGGVTVESEPGRGSVFRIFFPVSTEELPIQHDLPAMPEALLTGKAAKSSKIESGGTVLLIEDEDSVRNMAKKMLTCLGYVVIEAKDGVEAVDVFKQHQNEILCVLSDLTMPRMNGWETLAVLRKLSPDIPVILSSGYDKAKVMAEEHTEIPSAFLGKPYQLKGLRETISRVLADQK